MKKYFLFSVACLVAIAGLVGCEGNCKKAEAPAFSATLLNAMPTGSLDAYAGSSTAPTLLEKNVPSGKLSLPVSFAVLDTQQIRTAGSATPLVNNTQKLAKGAYFFVAYDVNAGPPVPASPKLKSVLVTTLPTTDQGTVYVVPCDPTQPNMDAYVVARGVTTVPATAPNFASLQEAEDLSKKDVGKTFNPGSYDVLFTVAGSKDLLASASVEVNSKSGVVVIPVHPSQSEFPLVFYPSLSYLNPASRGVGCGM